MFLPNPRRRSRLPRRPRRRVLQTIRRHLIPWKNTRTCHFVGRDKLGQGLSDTAGANLICHWDQDVVLRRPSLHGLLIVDNYNAHSASCDVNSGNSCWTSLQVFRPSTRSFRLSQMVFSSARTCFVLSRSRRVNVLSLTDTKSTVMPKGVPNSSFLE